MTSEDALRALEDATIYRNVRSGAEANTLAQEMDAATVALRERKETIDRLRGQLNSLQHDRNYAAVLFGAAAKTLDHVIRDFARAAGVSEDEMRKRYNVIRTQHFNQQVNDGIKQGWFTHDPRLDLSPEQKKNWFVSGLDSDHGF